MSINYNNDNTIIFTLARMNPPTPGHLYLILRLIEEALKKNINDVYVILSKTNDNNENPISCPEKINVLGEYNDITKTMINSQKGIMIDQAEDQEIKNKIQTIKVHTICVPDTKGATPFTPINDILESKKDIPDLNLFLIIGDDRQNMLDSITDFVFKKWDNVKSVDGIVLPREEMTQYKELTKDPEKLNSLNISDVPLNAMSASFVRNIVKNRRQDKFNELYSPFLEESKIPILYQAILNGIENLPANKKPDSPAQPLKYNYPMIKSEFQKRKLDESEITMSKSKKVKQKIGYGGKKSRKYKKNKIISYKKTKTIIKSHKNRRKSKMK
jgi:nicotinic acid mononucleotide adenylyltransferase